MSYIRTTTHSLPYKPFFSQMVSCYDLVTRSQIKNKHKTQQTKTWWTPFLVIFSRMQRNLNKINGITIRVQWQIYYSPLPHLLFTHKIHHEGSRDASICQACDFVKQHQTTAPWTRVCFSHTIPPLLFKLFHVLVCAVKSDGQTCASVNRSWPGRSCCVGCCPLSLTFSLNPVYAGAVNSSPHTNQRSRSDINVTELILNHVTTRL